MYTPIDKILFIDIETVPEKKSFDEHSEALQTLWSDKFEALRAYNPKKYGEETTAAEAFESYAGIYAEFGKIICISVGFIHKTKEGDRMRIKSFAGDDEKELLIQFNNLVLSFFKTSNHMFCGHNIKEFDIPYICRRMIIHNIKLPPVLQINNKKPWEVNFLDTLDFWKFGDYKNYTSLKLLTAVLGVPTPKDDIDGSQVASVYWQENDLKRIVNYCQKDVLATAQVWMRLNNIPQIDADNVEYVNDEM